MKTPDQMTREDYKSLGFKCGLEIHQQLDTKRKLFCRCPATHYSPHYDAELLRHMRPTLSELGEYDPTALMEFKTHKEIIYRIARGTVCTYEMDDTPPFMINEEALDIALEIALQLNLKLVSELHIARKQYLDGSIPTGFQRTTIVGVDGAIPFLGRILNIRQLGLEEDSCREVSDVGHTRTYMTDRLSIPLVETVTEPELFTPDEATAAGQLLRRLVRTTGRVRTGMGAARQDVNVSVTGGRRVEIKGVPRIPMIRALTHYEALRQRSLLDIRESLLRRGLTLEGFEGETVDLTGMVKRTHFAPIRTALDAGGRVLGVRLPGFAGILNTEIGPQVPFARDFSGRVKVIACLDQLPNMIWNDAPELTLASRLWERVLREMNATEQDTVVLVWGPERDADTAAKEILIRAKEALDGIPHETRKALKDGTTIFERQLPGPDRMYPDTDLPPKAITPDRIERVRARMRPRPWELIERYHQRGLPTHLATCMILDPRREAFERVLEDERTDASLAAKVIGQTLRQLRRKGKAVDRIADDLLVHLFSLRNQGRFAREAFPMLLEKLADQPGAEPEALLAELFPPRPELEPIEESISRMLSQKDWQRGDPDKEFRLCMGWVMKELRGRFPGAQVASVVKAFIARGGQS